MRVDRLTSAESPRGQRLSARVRPAQAEEFELWFELPDGFGGTDLDASPFLVGLLPRALASERELELEGCVSPALLASLEDAMRVYASFYPDSMRPITVNAEVAVPRPGPPITTCFFSRGVDSWYSVLAERQNRSDPPLTHLVHAIGIDINRDQRQEQLAIEAVRTAATVAELELVLCTTNLRRHTDPVLDWNPCHGAGMAALALALRPRRSLTPSGYAFGELMPAGSHLALDHRFSTESTAVEVHGEATRAEKVRSLACWPEALATVSVCFEGNLVGNCGDCSKCIHTMLELYVAGVDPRDAGFDQPLTPARVASVTFHPAGVHRYRETLQRLRERRGDGALAEAFELATLRGQTSLLAATLGDRGGDPRREASGLVARAAAVLDAAALAPPPARVERSAIGLVRCVDRRTGRHLYGFGEQPEGALPSAELGSLEAFRQDDSVAVWIDGLGRLRVEGAPAPPALSPSLPARLRFAVASLLRGGGFHPRQQFRDAWRRWRLSGPSSQGPAPAHAGVPVPVGYLHPEPGPGTRPLYSSLHPITGDQLLTNSPVEGAGMGYGPPELLGYLLDRGPVTGRADVGDP